MNENAIRRISPTPSQKPPRPARRAKNALRKESHRPARRERNLRPLTPPPPRGLPPMEAIGVTTIIGKRVCQKILADATIVAAQPPATNQTVLEATIKCDTMIMRTDTAGASGNMTGINAEATRRVTTVRSTIELVGQQHSAARQLNAILRGLTKRTAALRAHLGEVRLRPSASSRCRCLQRFALGCPPRHDLQAAARLVRLPSHNHPLTAPSLPP